VVALTLFLAGDVMIGRGIDQVLERSVDPTLFEPYVDSAETYVRLAESANGPIPRKVPVDYVWGSALADLDRVAPAARVVNLETTLTTSDEHSRDKDIHYRAHPDNVAVLAAAGIDCCSLANNHALDWGHAGLLETLDTLRRTGIATAGAGPDRAAAVAPAIVHTTAARVIVVAFASTNSGVPPGWAATDRWPGLEVIGDWSHRTAEAIAERLAPIRQTGDVVVASVHWGSNWGYRVPSQQRQLAHRLVDVAGVDVVHGHSSHHPRPIELYRGRLVLYGCGDFVTDYEGISGHEEFRSDLVLGYLPSLDATGALVRLRIAPYQLRRFQLVRPSSADAAWMAATLDRHSRPFGTRVDLGPDDWLDVSPTQRGA
jgi:poly-gamma-glutamate capsule biosynthesis protein CapA/YwtB (metallophosphatase superfamily)